MNNMTAKQCDLIAKKCVPCEGGVASFTREQAKNFLHKLKEGWKLNPEGTEISRRFEFKSYLRVMSFVNAVAWIANQENHHPCLEVGFNYCTVNYTTHAINGLSENDFICAAKVDALL